MLRAATARPVRRASLMDLDPDLFGGVGPRELPRAREIGAHVVKIKSGPWEPRFGAEVPLGLLVLDGLLTRRMVLGADVVTEIVGPGDIIRPWAAGGDDALVPCTVRWTALEQGRIAVLGRQVAAVAADCPGLVVTLLERAGRRSRSQGILTSVAHLKRVDLRVLVILWHLAERWGRVTPGGVVVPLRLTHQRLALLVGARRPTVTAALTRMSARGVVARTPDRGFVLTDVAREELDVLCRGGERAVAPLPQCA
jgi:CRP/FNR family cyclic AMP-dependent transcriptional regulator